ncbi:MAG: cation diffusion facilitator family transporter [Verrucomicrobiia bacterium]
MSTPARQKQWAAATSVVAALFLTGLKIVVGLMTGSLGILAEAAHSGLDLVAAVITLLAVRVSDRPADEQHMFGHGKVENLSALVETLLLLATCAWIIYEAGRRLLGIDLVNVDPSLWAFITMGISIVVDVSRSRMLSRAARKYHSQALEADALHFSTDVWSSVVVIVGLGFVRLGATTGHKTAFMSADAVAALVVAVIVIHVCVRLGRRTVDALLDRAPSGLAAQILEAAARVGNVRRVKQIRVRDSGNQIFVDLRVAVPRYLSFEESHAVTHQIRDAIRTVAPNADVTAKAVPTDDDDEGILERIHTVAARGHFAVHNVSTHQTKRGLWIDLDLEVAMDLSFEEAHALATNLETQLRAELSQCLSFTGMRKVMDINVHIEPRTDSVVEGKELQRRDAAEYIARIEANRRDIPHTHHCQDVQVQQVDGRIYLAFHLLVDANLPIAEVHRIAEEMETRLRREFPQLGRVVIHTEPVKKNGKGGT